LRSEKQEFESREIPIHRLVTVGTPDFKDLADFESEGGLVAQQLFQNIRGAALTTGNSDPAYGGMSPGSVMDQAQFIQDKTQAEVEDIIDNVADTTGVVTLYLHPDDIGDSGALTWSEVTSILDKLQSMRNSGDINLVTPSKARFLKSDCHDQLINPTPTSNYSRILKPSGGFPAAWNVTDNVSINTTTTNSRGYSIELQDGFESIQYLPARPPECNHIQFEAYARSKSTGTTADFFIRSDITDKYPDLPDGSQIGKKTFSVGDSWTKIQAVLGLPRTDTGMQTRIVNNGSQPLLIGDERLYYV